MIKRSVVFERVLNVRQFFYKNSREKSYSQTIELLHYLGKVTKEEANDLLRLLYQENREDVVVAETIIEVNYKDYIV